MLRKSPNQNIDGSNNISGLGDVNVNTTYNNYSIVEDTEISAPSVVDEILEYVISNVKNYNSESKKGLPEKLIKAETKIKRNFKKATEAEEVRQHFIYAYVNISLIEEKYQILENNLQNDIHGHIYSMYKELSETKTNIEVMRELFKVFLPKGKEMNSQFVNISKAFVLFFFDDCTIFEKTRQEKQQMKLNF